MGPHWRYSSATGFFMLWIQSFGKRIEVSESMMQWNINDDVSISMHIIMAVRHLYTHGVMRNWEIVSEYSSRRGSGNSEKNSSALITCWQFCVVQRTSTLRRLTTNSAKNRMATLVD